MKIPLQNDPVVVVANAVFFPQVLFQTNSYNGKLVTSAIINHGGILVENEGLANESWTPATGEQKSIVIDDISNLPEDLAEFGAETTQVYYALITLLAKLNAVRKVM